MGVRRVHTEGSGTCARFWIVRLIVAGQRILPEHVAHERVGLVPVQSGTRAGVLHGDRTEDRLSACGCQGAGMGDAWHMESPT